MRHRMPDSSTIAAALAAVPQASGRVAPPRIGPDGTASVILDVSGLDAAARDALEADVRRVLGTVEGIGAVRIVQTAQKPERRLIAVGSGKGLVKGFATIDNVALINVEGTGMVRGARLTALIDSAVRTVNAAWDARLACGNTLT